MQLVLPLDCAPARVRMHGLRAAHVRPRVGRRFEDGGFWSGRVPASHAWAFPYIETADAGAAWAAVVLDCDNRQAMAAGIGDLPPSNWLVRTRRGAHLTWCLAVPVAKHAAARRAPEQYLARVAEYYAHAVGADPGFAGLGRNPAHPDQTTEWGAPAPWTLAQLSNVIPFNWRRPRVAATGIGRNVDLFRTGMRWAGREENRGSAVLPALHAVNAEIGAQHGRSPLPDSEVGYIAKSVEKYREQWERGGWHCPAWLRKQAAVGRKGGLAGAGSPVRGPERASLLAHITNEDLRPWAAEGVSRRTWYYRRAGRVALIPNTDIPPVGGVVVSWSFSVGPAMGAAGDPCAETRTAARGPGVGSSV